MKNNSEARLCSSCNKPIHGRTDKKFCNDNCRNNYHNQLQAANNYSLRYINHALKKNRMILKSFIPEGEEIASTCREKLLQKGFRFKFITHHHLNKKGNQYSFCYDHGYLLLESETCLIVKAAEAEEL